MKYYSCYGHCAVLSPESTCWCRRGEAGNTRYTKLHEPQLVDPLLTFWRLLLIRWHHHIMNMVHTAALPDREFRIKLRALS